MIRVLLIILSFVTSNLCFADNEAKKHLKMMIEKYQSLSAYEDEGVSVTKFIRVDGSSFSNELRFKTKYNQNEVLIFEWLKMPNELFTKIMPPPGGFKSFDPHKPVKYSVWQNPQGIFTKYRSRKKRTEKSLSNALSGATGISSGLAWMVPRYLTPDIPCPPNLGANELKLLNSNNNIISIELNHNGNSIEVMHIDKETYLLKRYEKKRKLPNGTSAQQVAEFNVISYK